MKKRIEFSLLYRDMWQSSGKFQPTWHPSSFKSQFKHHFLREVSLQAQPGPMLPLKTTLHAFITHADVYASG